MFEILTALKFRIVVFCVVTRGRLAGGCQRAKGTYRPHFPPWRWRLQVATKCCNNLQDCTVTQPRRSQTECSNEVRRRVEFQSWTHSNYFLPLVHISCSLFPNLLTGTQRSESDRSALTPPPPNIRWLEDAGWLIWLAEEKDTVPFHLSIVLIHLYCFQGVSIKWPKRYSLLWFCTLCIYLYWARRTNVSSLYKRWQITAKKCLKDLRIHTSIWFNASTLSFSLIASRLC